MSRYLAISALLFAVVALTTTTGTVVTAQSPAPPSVTFHKDVEPILQKNCQACHRPGQIAPMSFLTYQATRPWARAIKNAVVNKVMPPWSADPAFGHFLNDRSLKPQEIDALVKWADGGAPQGDPKDAPQPVDWPTGGWQIKPDLIVDGPKYDVPAKGILEWTWVVVPGNFTEDTWVTSVEVKPSELAVTHHVCLAYVPHNPERKYYTPIARDVPRDAEGNEIKPEQQPGPGAFASGGRPDPNTIFGIIGASNGIEECYEPGRGPADFRPFGAAKLIPKGTDLAINFHYTPNGKAVTDHVQIGFTVSKEPPKRRFLALSMSSPQERNQFAIPPMAPNWEAPAATTTFTRDVELVGLMPHMHVRGKAARFFLDHPDGRTETILNVPRYDFNWQIWYDTSMKVQKGTKMRVLAWYDNSPANKFNPNPKATVYYGDQTWEEMHFPSYGVVVDDISLSQRDVVGRGGFVGGAPEPGGGPASN